MSAWRQYSVKCVDCGRLTSKTYARTHNGACKACSTGEVSVVRKADLCPDCGVGRLTAYQKQHRYHCDSCTRQADPIGYHNEVMGYND